MIPLSARKRTKRIVDHTPAELDAAVQAAVDKFGEDFWLLLHGVDAYMERRRRRVASAKAEQDREMAATLDQVRSEDAMWGDS